MVRREIISRKVWFGKAPKRKTLTKWREGGILWVHHSESTAPSAKATVKTESAIMRGIQTFHMGPQREWDDIGYGFVIFPSGRVYAGRGFGVVGAHTPGHNSEPSVCLIGSFSDSLPTTAALQSLNWLKSELLVKKLKGHRDGYPTSCPGNKFYARLKLPLPSWKRSEPDAATARGVTVRVMNREWVGWKEAKGAIRWIAAHGLRRGTKASITWHGETWTGGKAVANVCKNIYTNWIREEL